MENRRERTTVVRRRIHRRRPVRIYGLLVTVLGAAGIVFFAVVLEYLAYETALANSKKYGEAYDVIYNIDTLAYGLLGVISLVITVAGIGLMRLERWAIDCVWICGLIYVGVLWIFLVVRDYLTLSLLKTTEVTWGELTVPFVMSLVGGLFFIVPPLLPVIRGPVNR